MIDVYRSGSTKKWHTNANLSPQGQTIADHQCRVAQLLVLIFPDVERDVLISSVFHDAHRFWTGDISKCDNQLNKLYDEYVSSANEVDERESVPTEFIDDERFQLCDALEEYLFAAVSSQREIKKGEWYESRQHILSLSENLGVKDPVSWLIVQAEEV